MYHYQVGTTTRGFQVLSAIFWCLFAAGPLFGFAALKPFLIREHVYEDLCYESSAGISNTYRTFLERATVSQADSPIVPKCTDQDLKLNLIFTVCAVLTNVSALPIGYLLDNYGPKLCGLTGASFILAGAIMVINARTLDTGSRFDPYLTGYGLVSLGGPFTFISSFHLSNAFPKSSGTILALLTGAFDASSSVFLIYSISHKAVSSEDYYFSISDFFKVYLFVPLFIFAVQIFLMPKESYQAAATATTVSQDTEIEQHQQEAAAGLFDTDAVQNELNERSALLSGNKQGCKSRRSSLSDLTHVPVNKDEEEQEIVNSGGIFGILHGQTLKQQFSSNWFLLLATFTTIQMLRVNYFISTVNSQYTYLLGSHEAATSLNEIFDVALPLGGLVSIPFVGYFLDHYSTVTVAAALTGLSVVLGVLGFIPRAFFAGVLNVLLFVVYRPFFYTTISDIAGKVFGFETFGIVYGSMMSISGMVNFTQSYFDKLTHTVFKMNPGPINYIFVSATVLVGGLMVGYIKYESDHYGKQKVQKLLAQQADPEHEDAVV